METSLQKFFCEGIFVCFFKLSLNEEKKEELAMTEIEDYDRLRLMWRENNLLTKR